MSEDSLVPAINTKQELRRHFRQLRREQSSLFPAIHAAVVAELEATDEVMPGVVSLPHGWGHGRNGVQAQIAQAHAGVSVNDLTDDQFLDELSGNAALNGVPVAISAA